MKKLLLTSVCIFVTVLVSAQDAQTNLLKYWKYRERLKNFVVVGDCQGCSLPCSRSDQQISIHDGTHRLGYYIGMLALEYAVLVKKGITDIHSAPLSTTIRDLYYAIEAVNRLDENAENWITQATCASPPCTSPGPNLNGFFIRDDMAPDKGTGKWGAQPFLSETDAVTNEKIEDALNSNLFPLPDGTTQDLADNSSDGPNRVTDVTSSFQASSLPAGDPKAMEESQDQVVGLLVGFALVSKLIPSLKYYVSGNPVPFSDGVTDFNTEVKNQADRIVHYMSSVWTGHPWGIQDPITLQAVENGNDARTFSYGFEASACEIESDFTIPSWAVPCINKPSMSFAATTYVLSLILRIPIPYPPYLIDGWELEGIGLDADATVSNICCNTFGNNDARCKPAGNLSDNISMWLTLSAISGAFNYIPLDTYEAATDDICGRYFVYDIIPMLHQILWSGGNLYYSNSHYTDLLDEAPCIGITGHNGCSDGWNSGDREWTGIGTCPGSSDYFNGIDYMFIFNMYNLLDPSYEPDYNYFNPELLQPESIIKDNYVEHDTKNFLATNSITASSYTITGTDCSDYPNVPTPCNIANVSFQVAPGGSIVMGHGFQVAGGKFIATCNTAIQSLLDCSQENHKPIKVVNNDSNSGAPNDSSSTETANLNNLKVMPNPTHGQFMLRLNETGDSAQQVNYIYIYNTMAQLIVQTTSKDNTISINISNYPAGLYLIRVQSGGNSWCKKVVKE